MMFRAFLLAVAFCINTPAPGWANASLGLPGIRMPEPVTANVADDFDPTISGDGRYLAFVSTRENNTDIWLKILGKKNIETWLKILRGKDTKGWLNLFKGGGLLPTTLFRITTDTSHDTSPAISPDGKRLAFISTRSDPKGDLYLLDLSSLPLDNPTPIRLTGIDTVDSDPAFSPDGKTIAYTSSPSATRKENIWLYDISTKTKQQLTANGGFTPAISADGRYLAYVVREKDGTGGDLALMRLADRRTVPFISSAFTEGFPAWDNKNIFFVRYAEDTDGDGKITLKDRSDIYSAPFSPDIFEGAPHPISRQLTSTDTYDLFPCVNQGKLYLSSSHQGRDQEVYVMDKGGITSSRKPVVEEIQRNYPEYKYLPLLVLSNFIHDADTSTPNNLLAGARFKRAVLYQESIKNLRAAQNEFQRVIKEYPYQSPYPNLALIRLARIEVELAREADSKKAEGLIRRKIEELNILVQNKKFPPEVRGKALLAVGDFFGMLSDMSSALSAFIQVSERFGSSFDLAAQALFHAGEIYRIFQEDSDKVQGAYLKIITDYPPNTIWANRAAQAIIEMSEEKNIEKTIANLRELQDFYPDLLSLVAKTKNRIGDLYEKIGKFPQAKTEYAGVIRDFADQKKEVDNARFSLARIYYKQKKFENCLEVYREIERNTSEREEVYHLARRNYIRRSLEKAKGEFLEGEPRLAIKSYLRLIEYDYSILEAHRGILRVYASLKEIDRVINRLKKQTQDGNYISHYVLGLAFTYSDPPDLDGAEENIKDSLAIYFRSPYPHQTLGWIYEQREQVYREGNFFEKALSEYQVALSLNNPAQNPLNQAYLYANIGNCYFQLKNYRLAYNAYQKRAIYPFDDKKNESIFYQRFGDTAFRTGETDKAVLYYERAMKNARKTADNNRLALLYDKLALASQDTGNFKTAAHYFTESLEYNRKLKNLSNVTLALRNIAYNLYYLSRHENREKNLKSALDYYQQSLKNLKLHGGKRTKKSRGLLQIELEVGGDESGSSAGFDPIGEEKLITTYMGRIFRESGNHRKALKYLEKKISLLPGDWEKNVSRASEQSIVLNQAGTLASNLGEHKKALNYFISSFNIATKQENKTGMVKNAINIAQIVLAHRDESAETIPKYMRMVSTALETIGPESRYLEQRIALQNALALLWYNCPVSTVSGDSDKKRIENALWNLKREAMPVALLKEALDLINKNTDNPALTEKRVILLANLAQVSAPSAESAKYLRQALDLARETGQDNIRWRLMLEEAGNNFTHLKETARILESISPERQKTFPNDGELIEKLYGSMILHLVKKEKWKEAFTVSERFRTRIYLRTLEQVSSLPRQADIDEVRKYLQPGDLLLKYEQIKEETFWWRADKNSFSAGRVPRSSRPVSQDVFARKLLEPISLEGVNRLYLILPPALNDVSWEAVTINGKPLIEHTALIRLSGLNHFLNSYQARKLAPLKLFLVAEEEKAVTSDTFANPGKWIEGVDFPAGRWSVIHLNLPMEEDFHPVKWVLPTTLDIGNRISPFDFHKERKQLIVFFSPSPQTAAQTAHDLAWAGFPSTLVYHGSPRVKRRFFQTFYGHLARNTPARALQMTLTSLIKNFPRDWACASLYGFGGMGRKERERFAREQFSTNLKKGIMAYRNKLWDRAIGHLEEALSMMHVLKITRNRDRVYRSLVDSFYFSKNYPSAIDYQKKLIAFYKNQTDPDWEVLADAHHHLGVLYSRAEKFEDAAYELSAALKIYREYGMTDKLARGYGTLGVVEEHASDYQEALKSFEAALRQNKELEDLPGMGKQLRRLGRIYYLRLNNYTEAESIFQNAREIFRKAGDKSQLAETTLELGLVKEKMADFPAALLFYQEGLQLARDAGDKLVLSKAAVNIANVAWFQGDYQTAFTRQREALALAEEIGNVRAQQIAVNLAGLIYWTLNDYEKALKHLHKAMELAEAAGSRIDIASAYNNIGLIHRERKDYITALENFRHALSVDRSIGSLWGEGYDYRNIGIVHLRRKEFEKARKNLEAAVRISGKISNRINEVKALLELGNLAYEINDYPTTHRYLEETTQLSKKLGMPEVLWRALMKLGELAEAEEKPQTALDNYAQAIGVVEKMRASIKVEEFKNGFLTNKTDLYDKMILLLIRLGKVEEAFNMSERSRARSFIDILGNRHITLKDTVSQELIDRQKLLKNQILAMEKRLYAEGGDQFKKDLVDLRHRYEDLLIEIKQLNPQLSAFVTVDPLTYQDVRHIIEGNVALLEYHITEDRVLVWVVKKDSIRVRQIRIKRDFLTRTILDYRLLLQNLEPHRKPSQTLYRLLIEPVEEDIDGVGVLGIAPHGPLHYLAFASLWDKDRYLVEKFPIFYVPSASLLKFVSGKVRKPISKTWVLAVGNPDLGSLNYDLPLSEMEVESMKWNFPKVDILIRDKATEGWVIKNIGRYDIIHFATHGEFDSVNPLFSALKLTGETGFDGNLEVEEVFALNLKADMVTLSACQTGLGKIMAGDEIVGLNRAFLYAGTRSILSTLWRVSDLTTAVLIKHFYRNYSRLSKAESLQKAQTLVMKYFSHPAYWAGLSLTGDYR